MQSDDEALSRGLDMGTQIALSQTARYVTAAVTGNPLLGRVAGMATSAAYSQIPDTVKGGALVGGLAAVNVAGVTGSVGLAGSLAAAGAALAAAPFFIAGGALIGGLFWLFGEE